MVTAGVRSGSAPPLEAIRRRTTALLSLAQVMGGVAVAGSLPAGALIGASLGGSAAAGLAQTAGVLGAAVVALPLARIALSRGRRASLSAGYAVGALGAAIVVIGGVQRALWTVLLGCLLLGAATAAGYQARYAATDLADPSHRGRALSTVVWAGTVGAVLGPNLLQVSGRLAMHDGLPQLTGPFVLAAGVLALSACLLLILLRPDPYLLSRSLSNADGLTSPKPRLRDGFAHLKGHRRAQLGITSLSIGHVVMIMIMVMTPVHMQHVDVSLQLIGLVISVHVLGMFALSPIVGWGADRFGREQVILAGAGVLLGSALISGLAPADSVVALSVGLFLLGLGWSCTLIAGSTLLTDDVDPADRPAIQGLADLVMNVAGAAGGVIAGVIVIASSYTVLCFAAALPVLALLLMVGFVRRAG